MLLVLAATLGLDLPVLRLHRPYFPLAVPTLKLSRRALEQCTTAGNVVGLSFTPRGQTSAPNGTCGVLCELSGCDEADDDDCVVRAVAFSRYRVCNECSAAGGNALPVFRVEPWLDLEPEDDPLLREHYGLTERGNALAAMEVPQRWRLTGDVEANCGSQLSPPWIEGSCVKFARVAGQF